MAHHGYNVLPTANTCLSVYSTSKWLHMTPSCNLNVGKVVLIITNLFIMYGTLFYPSMLYMQHKSGTYTLYLSCNGTFVRVVLCYLHDLLIESQSSKGKHMFPLLLTLFWYTQMLYYVYCPSCLLYIILYTNKGKYSFLVCLIVALL